jgi:hypothetical protein
MIGRELADLRQDPGWPTAIHEAAHAVVGLALGGTLRAVMSVPPRACVEYPPTISRRALLTAAVAGPAAERMAKGRGAVDTLDASVNQFFEQLGDEGIDSFRADGLAAAAEEDDLDLVIPLIESYSSRGQGLAQFRRARAQAIRILQERWDEVEEFARPLMEQLGAQGH